MHRLINSVGKIEIHEDLKAVEIKLKGYGHFNEYLDTFKMAIYFADLHRLHTYLLIKSHFEDVTYQQFYHILAEWLTLMGDDLIKNTIKIRVALLVDKPDFLKLLEIIHKAEQELPIEYYHVYCDLFCNPHDAYCFLQPKSDEVIHQGM